ncbi:hypothetical protein [Congregicoccus parvus]
MSIAIKRYAVVVGASAVIVTLVAVGIVIVRGRPWSGLPLVPDVAGVRKL